ncbi:MAG: hypothetical protein ACP5OA_07335 [Candidatus Woesearchaeota archaeon]
MEGKDLELILKLNQNSSKDIESMLKKYPYTYEILVKSKNASGVYVRPVTPEIREGTGYSYDSGYNYFSETKKLGDVYVEYFDTWGDESDRSSQVTFYIPVMAVEKNIDKL